MIVAPFAISLLISFLSVPLLIPRLSRAGIVGKDLHKPCGIDNAEDIPEGRPQGIVDSEGIPQGRPEVSEMGGLGIVVGFGGGILLATAMVSFFHVFPSVDLIVLLAVLSTVLLAGLIGIVDDLLGGCSKSNPVTTPASGGVVSSKPATTPPEGMRQWMKAMIGRW